MKLRIASLLVTLAGVAAQLFGQCPGASPRIQSPADGATNIAPNVTLTWAAVSGADSYDVFIGTGLATGCPLIATATTSNTTYTAQLSAGTRYQWRVAAKKSGTPCPAQSSACVTFTTAAVASNCPTSAPQLESPANGASNVASPVRFDWDSVTGATLYRLMAAFNGGAANPIAITRDTEYSTSVPSGSVEWWVEALAENCQTLGSPHYKFTAAGGACPTNPQSPTLISPAVAASVNSPVTFTWTAVSGASSYRVWAATAGGAIASLVGSSSTTSLSAPLPMGAVIWYVEARFDNCPSTFSSRGTFIVASPTVCNNSPTTLVSPANNATNVPSNATFTWTAVPGAIGYKLFIAGELAGVTTDTTLSRLVPQGLTTWWVDTAFAGCPDQHSAEFKFSTAATNCPTGTMTLTSPANGATAASPVAYSWTGIAGATAYRLWVSLDGSAPQLSGRVTTTSVTLPNPSGAIVWQVEALFDNCPSIFSPRGNFTVSASANCSQNSAPTLVSPISGSQSQTSVDFTWNAVPGTLAYRVWASLNGDAFADLGVTSNTHLKTDLSAGSVVWYVEAIFGGCPPLASARASFKINAAGCPTEAPLLIAPADNAANVTAPVTLIWSAVDRVKKYRVFASLNGTDFGLIDATTDTSLSKAIPPGTVTWFVEATFDDCPSVRSAKSKFTVPRAAQCSGEAPQLVAPANNANNVTSPVHFDWNPVSGAIGYHLMARFSGGNPTRIGETTDTDFDKKLPEGTFEWWVVAFFVGCPPTESSHLSFTIPATACNNRSSLLWSPAEGDTGLVSPVRLRWSKVPGAKSYKVWGSVNGDGVSLIGSTAANELVATLPSGSIEWHVDAIFDNCPAATSADSSFAIRKNAPACATPNRPLASVPGQVVSGTPFTVHWTPVVNTSSFELQEANNPDFTGATTSVTDGLSMSFSHAVTDQPQRFYYRVRAVSSCSDDRSHYSKVVSVVIVPQKAKQASADVGVQSGVTQQIVIPGQTPSVNFTARGDKPWITVTPSSGTIGPQGITLTVTYDPAALKLGTNTGTVVITTGSSGRYVTNGVAPAIPVSVSLVTPVAPGGKNAPPPDSLIIPAVGHAAGANDSLFESDVRVANVSARPQKYQLNFTLSGTDGTQSGQSTTIDVDPGATMALDDILTNFFGIGSDGGSATGVLEIRPLTSSTTNLSTSVTPSVTTVASSRTFNATPNGTFGQFIPAVPFSQFVGSGNRLSLQQIAQSPAFRTNLGLVEAAGETANVLVHVFDNSGRELAQIPETLQPSEHLQINNFLSVNGITLTDGRFEVEVTSPTGKVTAYASVVDNFTNDPLLVSPVLKSGTSATRFVLPGVGDFDVGGIAHWKSDVRLFNSGATALPIALSYFPQGDSAHPVTTTMTVQAGEVRALDNLIASTLPQAGLQTAGSLLVSTTNPSALVATARTYTQTTSGTYGQFIPAVTTAQSVGNGERSLQLLQLEASDRYRTNIGLAETSGIAATAHVSLILPDSKFAISTDIPLAANEFRQISLASFGAGTVYNGRVTVSVNAGSGRVTAYGSVIDQITQDPTYVPAQ
ncbi:MAG: hypothetical protein DMF59_00865 [Acidobacteria bacterium]|nr:MAG: hypothetical protein DMF59_00865 [Acidobacteriota bacterium]